MVCTFFNYHLGMTEENIKATGRMVSNTVKENFCILKKDYGRKEFGQKEKELNGKTQLHNERIVFLYLIINKQNKKKIIKYLKLLI